MRKSTPKITTPYVLATESSTYYKEVSEGKIVMTEFIEDAKVIDVSKLDFELSYLKALPCCKTIVQFLKPVPFNSLAKRM